jgi:hypothetical protein
MDSIRYPTLRIDNKRTIIWVLTVITMLVIITIIIWIVMKSLLRVLILVSIVWLIVCLILTLDLGERHKYLELDLKVWQVKRFWEMWNPNVNHRSMYSNLCFQSFQWLSKYIKKDLLPHLVSGVTIAVFQGPESKIFSLFINHSNQLYE